VINFWKIFVLYLNQESSRVCDDWNRLPWWVVSGDRPTSGRSVIISLSFIAKVIRDYSTPLCVSVSAINHY